MPKTYQNITYSLLKTFPNEYQRLTEDHFRTVAATQIQRTYKLYKNFLGNTNFKDFYKKTKKNWAPLPVFKEPKISDDVFLENLQIKVKLGRYNEVDYQHIEFVQHLFLALRLGLINSNDLTTIKLMYDALIAFNEGKELIGDQSARFKRFILEIGGSPYDPNSISYMHEAARNNLQKLLDDDKKNSIHYYTIDLSSKQTDSFIDIFFTKKSFNPIKEKLLNAYIQQKNISNKNELKQFLSNRLQNNTNLSFNEEFKDRSSLMFLDVILSVGSQNPSVVISPNYKKEDENSPLISFVIPTIDMFHALQDSVHGAETVFVYPLIGKQTTRMIRALDELPAVRLKEEKLNYAEEILQILYPNAALLQRPARPIELTYPGIPNTIKPHGYYCYDFFLIWHDLFHAWRSGENFKELFRRLRKIHDERAGIALLKNAMSKSIWRLSDMDSSLGVVHREASFNQPQNLAYEFFLMLKIAGYDTDQPIDNNYLILYDIIKNKEFWEKQPIYYNLKEPFFLKGNLGILEFKQINGLIYSLKRVEKKILKHPSFSSIEILLEELLNSLLQDDDLFIELINKIEINKTFYWCANTGIYFTSWALEKLNLLSFSIEPCLRKNKPGDLLYVLCYMVRENISPELFTTAINIKTLSSVSFYSKFLLYTQYGIKEHDLLQIFTIDAIGQVISKLNEQVSPINDTNKILSILYHQTVNEDLKKNLIVKNIDNKLNQNTLYNKRCSILDNVITNRLSAYPRTIATINIVDENLTAWKNILFSMFSVDDNFQLTNKDGKLMEFTKISDIHRYIFHQTDNNILRLNIMYDKMYFFRGLEDDRPSIGIKSITKEEEIHNFYNNINLEIDKDLLSIIKIYDIMYQMVEKNNHAYYKSSGNENLSMIQINHLWLIQKSFVTRVEKFVNNNEGCFKPLQNSLENKNYFFYKTFKRSNFFIKPKVNIILQKLIEICQKAQTNSTSQTISAAST